MGRTIRIDVRKSGKPERSLYQWQFRSAACSILTAWSTMLKIHLN